MLRRAYDDDPPHCGCAAPHCSKATEGWPVVRVLVPSLFMIDLHQKSFKQAREQSIQCTDTTSSATPNQAGGALRM